MSTKKSSSKSGKSGDGYSVTYTEGGTPVVTPEPVPFDLNIDILKSAGKIADFNTAQYLGAFNSVAPLAQDLLSQDAKYLQSYAPKAAALSRQETAKDNTFNQGELKRAIDSQFPELYGQVRDGLTRASTYADGRLLSSMDDRAMEATARNASAEGSTGRGFGDDSVFGAKNSDLLSAQQRLGISQYGDQSVKEWLTLGSQLMVDRPIKANTGGQIGVTPDVMPSRMNATLAAGIAGSNMVNPTAQAQMDYNIGLEKYYAQVADNYASANALQMAYNQEANAEQADMANQQYMAGQKAQQKSANTQAIASGVATVAVLALAFL